MFYARVSAINQQRIANDPWLACFDWCFLDVTGTGGAPAELVVVDHPDRLLALGQGIPCWCFGALDVDWVCPDGVDALAALFDLAILSDRLLAWLWLRAKLMPSCFSSLSLRLANGGLSFSSLEISLYLMQMAVSPTSEVGGDVALYVESATHSLVVLADAIGHGDEAALDAAQFVLAVVRHMVGSALDADCLQRLGQALTQRLARGRFVAAAFLEIECDAGRVRLLNAGMPDILWLCQGRLRQGFPSTRAPLGVNDGLPSAVTELALTPCSQWVMHSDGVDGAALRCSLASLSRNGTLNDFCPEFCGVALMVPLLKTNEVIDDASQVIVGIP